MTIWHYNPSNTDVVSIRNSVKSSSCLFCSEPLFDLKNRHHEDVQVCEIESIKKPLDKLTWDIESKLRIRVCRVCGWWTAFKQLNETCGSWTSFFEFGATGSLLDLDLTDINAPLSEVRAYLSAKYHERSMIHPRVFEETVASVFSDLGYLSHVTGYSSDGGIDIILENSDGNLIGVQVKRYKNSIKIEQIRSLAGALVLAGITKGIFVTTSSFQSGGNDTVSRLRNRGYEIELVDACKFYDALKIAQRKQYEFMDDPTAPYTEASYVKIMETASM